MVSMVPPAASILAFAVAENLHSEVPVSVVGKVGPRPPESLNPNLPTGRLEVEASEIEVLNSCKPLPF